MHHFNNNGQTEQEMCRGLVGPAEGSKDAAKCEGMHPTGLLMSWPVFYKKQDGANEEKHSCDWFKGDMI